MKKILLCVLGFMILVSGSAFAVDVTVWASTWYAWWDNGDSNSNNDPGFLYGPALAVKFNDDFNLTGVFLYGKIKYKDEDDGDVFTFKRIDSDLALNYRLNDYLKIFAGIKYMSYTIVDADDFDHSGFGPGIGISAAYPVVDSLFLLATLSGFHLWGNEEEGDESPDEYGYREYGINTTLALAYYIPSISTVISLGGRYQQFKTVYNQEEVNSGEEVDDLTWKFYGITLTVTYTF